MPLQPRVLCLLLMAWALSGPTHALDRQWQLVLPGGSGDPDLWLHDLACQAQGLCATAMTSSSWQLGGDSSVAHYAGDGTLRWRRTWTVRVDPQSPRLLVMDASGDVFVAESAIVSSTAPDWTVRALAAQDGAERWRYLHVAVGLGDQARAMIQLSDGHLLVASSVARDRGSDLLLSKIHRETGALLWQQIEAPAAFQDVLLRALPDGAAYVAIKVGTSNGARVRLLRLDGLSGGAQWRADAGIVSSDLAEHPIALESSLDGDLVLLADERGFNMSQQVSLIRLDGATGVRKWRRDLQGTAGAWADSLARVGDGRFVVGLRRPDGGTAVRGWLVSVLANGNLGWSLSLDDWGSNLAQVQAASAADGSLLVLGRDRAGAEARAHRARVGVLDGVLRWSNSEAAPWLSERALPRSLLASVGPDGLRLAKAVAERIHDDDVRLSAIELATGAKIWEQGDGPYTGGTESLACNGTSVPAKFVAIDAAGAIYLASCAVMGDGRGGDLTVSKISAGGQILWRRHFDRGIDEAAGLALDGLGSLFVIGGSSSPTESGMRHDAVLLKLHTETGQALWERRDGGGLGYHRSLALDPQAHPYTLQDLGAGALRVSRHDPADGVQLWSSPDNLAAIRRDTSTLEVLPDGDVVYMTANFLQAPSGRDFRLVRLRQGDGARLWSRVRTEGNADVGRPRIAQGPNGAIYSGVRVTRINTDELIVDRYAADDGQAQWQWRSGPLPATSPWTSTVQRILDVPGRPLLALGNARANGLLATFDRLDGTLLWRTPLPAGSGPLGEGFQLANAAVWGPGSRVQVALQVKADAVSPIDGALIEVDLDSGTMRERDEQLFGLGAASAPLAMLQAPDGSIRLLGSADAFRPSRLALISFRSGTRLADGFELP